MQQPQRIALFKQVLKNLPRDRIEHERVMRRFFQKTKSKLVLRPERWLGAPWMDELKEHRHIVDLCGACESKYGNWESRYNYRRQKGIRKIGDCDGCRMQLLYVTGYYPLETYDKQKINFRR
jgi:hypothetical protein